VLKTLVTLLVAGILWATGCAGVRAPGTEDAAPGPVAQGAPDPGDENDPVFLMLAAEVAGQRGQFELALDYYMRALQLTHDPKVAARATQVAVYVKNADKATEAAEVWAELDPKSLSAHRLTLILRVKNDEIGEAADEIRQLIELKDPDLENTLIELVRWIDAEKERERGLEIMRDLVDRLPKVAEVHLAAAYLATEEGALLVAQEEVARALAMRPNWSRALMLQAQLLLQAGELRAGRAALEKAYRIDPKNARLGLIYGQFLAKMGEFPAAERELAKVVSRDPGNDDARFALASVWLEMGDLAKARKEFDLLSSDQRWRPQAAFSIALIDAREGRTEAALKEFDQISEGPMLFDARFNAISALIVLGRTAEARDRLASARVEFPKERLRLFLIEAEMLIKLRQTETAFDLLSDAIRQMPDQPELLYTRGLLGEQLKRLDVMEADLKALLEKNPEDAAALNALGFSLTVHYPDRLDEAEGYIRRALAKRPGDPAILDSYGWVLFRKGKVQDALAPLKKAYGLFADPEIAAHLGEVLWVMGRKAEARQIWLDAWKRDAQQQDMQRIHQTYPEVFTGAAK
jgi:tetratricopeptide (TPR) repeat protein